MNTGGTVATTGDRACSPLNLWPLMSTERSTRTQTRPTKPMKVVLLSIRIAHVNVANYPENAGTVSQQLESYSTRPPTPVIDESRVDECLLLIEDADPTGEMRPDPPELSKLEAQCRVMGPLIDQELEKVDRSVVRWSLLALNSVTAAITICWWS